MPITDNKVFYFNEGSLEKQLATLSSKGITQFEVHDSSICTNKARLLEFIQIALKKAPDVFFDFYLKAAAGPNSIIEDETIEAFSQLFCSIHIPLPSKEFLKPFSKKIAQLNNAGLVFGFEIDINCFSGIHSFCDVLDFAINLYPNDIIINTEDLNPTEKLSTQDIKKIKQLSFAQDTFYSAGRAVPWFCVAVEPLHIKPAKFFADFSEWLYCNNASSKEFNPSLVSQTELEKMQLIFLQFKYEEKHLQHVFLALKDLIKLQGSFSRVSAGEISEETFDISYNPDDLLSAFAMNIVSFADQVCMENTTVHVFVGREGPEFEVVTL
jgi:hypothetical protein